jgi:hypothetical protein
MLTEHFYDNYILQNEKGCLFFYKFTNLFTGLKKKTIKSLHVPQHSLSCHIILSQQQEEDRMEM